MKVAIAGGGTGGHLFPAVALGEAMRRLRPDVEILHIGTSNGLEAAWLPKSGLRYELFPVHGLRGKNPLSRMRALGEFFAAIGRARKTLKAFDADLVVSAGGYASAPTAVAAIVGRIPLLLMEQNTRPGLSNRILWRFARQVCAGFADTAACFPAGRASVTGNPVRLRFIPGRLLKISHPIQILVLGGSSGAHRLNLGVLKALNILDNDVIKFKVTHQTGGADAELVAAQYRDLGVAADVTPFIDDMALALDRAELVIARAGAMTVSELALAGRPALFVPYPFHRDRQQELNARVIERLGGALIVMDDDRLGENLAAHLREIAADPSRLIAMGERAREAAYPDAAARISRICFEIAGGERAAA